MKMFASANGSFILALTCMILLLPLGQCRPHFGWNSDEDSDEVGEMEALPSLYRPSRAVDLGDGVQLKSIILRPTRKEHREPIRLGKRFLVFV